METKDFLHNFSFYFQYPTQVQFDITNHCNLECLYCYNKASEFFSNKDMTDKEVMTVIDKIIKQLNPLFVSFSGGEPFIRKRLLFKCIQKLKSNKIDVHINTNGTLIDRKVAQRLHDLNVDKININLESLDPKKHDLVRGKKGCFQKITSNLEILKRYVGSKRISIATVVTKENIDSILDLAHFVKDNGFMEFHLLDMIPTRNNEHKYVPEKKDWFKFYKIFEDISKLNIDIKPNHALLFMKKFKKKIPFPFCMAGRLKMVICADGNIVPCDYFKSKKFVCGNALTDDLEKVWLDSDIMNKFRYSMKGYESCFSCKFIKKCGGGCKALSLAFCGSPFKPDPYCSIYGFEMD